MKNIVILISGRGSNMRAIVDAAIPGTRIAAVISNRPDAGGLAFARERGIATAVVDHKAYGSREMFEEMNRAISVAGMRPVIDKVFGFDEAVSALRHLDSATHCGKVCIRM